MICTENNGFTTELDEVITGWHASIYGLLGAKVIDTDPQNVELISKLFHEQDEILANL
jgi:hypothetical protein